MSGEIVFDIETGPLPWEQLAAVYEPPSALPPWDDTMVRYGQTKDPTKRLEKYEQVKAEYMARLAKEAEEREVHRCEWASKAALSPLTGRVLAIGARTLSQVAVIGEDGETEPEILDVFWSIYKKYRAARNRMIGFNCAGFDVPFLVRRSWWHGIPVPESLFERGRYLCPTFVDLMLLWAAGGRDWVSLDTLAKFFGIGGKPEGIDGGMFGSLWNSGNAASRQTAINYLANDLEMTWKLAERMGVIT